MVSNGVIRIRPKRYEAVTVWAKKISKMLELGASGAFCGLGLALGAASSETCRRLVSQRDQLCRIRISFSGL